MGDEAEESEGEEMNNRVKMFDYWAFHGDGSVQFFQITEGRISDYRHYANSKDAPVAILDERTWCPGFVGPILPLRYHGRSYYGPTGD